MDSGFILTAGGTALICSMLLQAMKKSERAIFDFVGTEANKWKANLIVSIIIAFITALGIGYKYDVHYDANTGQLVGNFLVTGLTAAGIIHGLWHWFFQWIGQHVAYKGLVVPTELQAANIDVLNKLLSQLQTNSTFLKVGADAKVSSISASTTNPDK